MDKRTIFVIFLFLFAVTPLVMVGCGVLADGGIYHFKCMGAIEGNRWLDGRTIDSSVGLAPITTGGYTGTSWQAFEVEPGIYHFKCMGDVEGNRWLDGRTIDGSVGLAPTTTGGYTGTSWQAFEVEPGIYHFKCMGDVEGNRWLDGRTIDGSVGLAPTTTGGYTGTSWQALEVTTAHPDSNPNNGSLPSFDDHKSSSFNIATPETKPIVTTTIINPSPAAPAPATQPAPIVQADNDNSNFDMGVDLAKQGMYEQALDAFNRQINLVPGESDRWNIVWAWKAAALYKLGRYEEAREAIVHELQLNQFKENTLDSLIKQIGLLGKSNQILSDADVQDFTNQMENNSNSSDTQSSDAHAPDAHAPDAQAPDTQAPDAQAPDTQAPAQTSDSCCVGSCRTT